MKIAYEKNLRLSWPNIARLVQTNEIIDEYAAEGYRLTLRQLYYQLVSRNIVANTKAEYGKLSGLLVKGRMAGFTDWDAIEDRIRVPRLPYWVNGVEDALDDTVAAYRLDRMKGQENYIELWVEKDALSGVLMPITNEYHINLMVNRGYSSCTAMHDAFTRIEAAVGCGQRATILYLGDHDPSGLDMVRDIRSRLETFGADTNVLDVIGIGLTMNQIQEHNPPPNPAKITDPRAKGYIRLFGPTSWEVDALNPKVLHALVRNNVERLIDRELFNQRIEQEARDKETLRELSGR